MPETVVSEAKPRAQLALADSPIHVLRQLHVECRENALLLSGRVDTFYHKQLAQEVVRAVANGVPLINRIDVD